MSIALRATQAIRWIALSTLPPLMRSMNTLSITNWE